CVATRVGDSSWLVMDDSLLAEPGDWRSLADAIANAVSRLPSWNGEHARQRVAEQLSAVSAIAGSERLIARAIAHRRGVGNAMTTLGD
ncbi:MAG: hypothetical protein KIS79_04115, partial [Burkholderiales bacterium]|nr:hypothetical protein [Burkholderiales bacterium]